MSSAVSLVLNLDGTVQLDDFGKLGRAYGETDENDTSFVSVVVDLLTGQFKNPVAVLPARSCLIDGEVIGTDEADIAIFNLPHFLAQRARCRASPKARILRRLPIEDRKARLARLLRKPPYGITTLANSAAIRTPKQRTTASDH
jgi:hypothetical protein